MTDKQQSAFFLAIVFLFTSGIGLVIYRQYDLYYQQKTATDLETASIPSVPWKTYTNTEYGFQLKFPPSWSSMKVIENGGADFYLPWAKPLGNQTYGFVCGIKVYSQAEWNTLQNSSDPHSSDIIAQKPNTVYTPVCGADGSGFQGFEASDAATSTKDSNFYKNPIDEFNNLIIPTFKFIN